MRMALYVAVGPSVGTLKEVGRIYQQTFLDSYTKLVFAKLYNRKTPLVEADLFNDRGSRSAMSLP